MSPWKNTIFPPAHKTCIRLALILPFTGAYFDTHCHLRSECTFGRAGAQHLQQWELAVEEAAAELHNTEDGVQEATRQLLALQARCAEAAAQLLSQESATQTVRPIMLPPTRD